MDEGPAVEIKIGVQNTPREIAVDTDASPAEIQAAVEAAIANGGVLTLKDERDRTVLVPADKIAYVEIGPASTRKVGFGSAI
jgi:hypothetical protein